MRNFKIGDLNITAASKEEAERIADELGNSRANRIIFAYDDGTVQMINLKDRSCVVFSQSSTSVTRVGRLVAGSGDQIIQAAVRNIDSTEKDAAKMRAHSKKRNFLQRQDELKVIIENFEVKVPEKAKADFLSITKTITGDNPSYKVEMYQQIDHAINLNHNNWFTILPWFRANVMPHDGTLFAKRKAFVTAVCRMGEQEYEIGNVVEGTVDQNDGDFWAKFVDEESARGKADS